MIFLTVVTFEEGGSGPGEIASGCVQSGKRQAGEESGRRDRREKANTLLVFPDLYQGPQATFYTKRGTLDFGTKKKNDFSSR